jgi:DNA polymerase I
MMFGRLPPSWLPPGWPFDNTYVEDTEYNQQDGGLPDTLCVCALNLNTGARIKLWIDRDDPPPCPFDTGPRSVFIGHNYLAEAHCHRVLGWPLPTYVLDTYVEVRAESNGWPFQKAGLLEAAARLGIPTITSDLKEHGRSIAIAGRAHAEQHKDELMAYCESDVDTNADLFLALLPRILRRRMGLARSLIWGDYMMALSSVEHVGVPINRSLLARLQAHWQELRHQLVDRIDTGKTDCYVNYTFNRARFAELLRRLGLYDGWPKSEKLGYPMLEDKVFRNRAHGHPVLGPLYELHATLEQLKTLTLHVGPDGRHRAVGTLGTGSQKRSAGLYAFGTRTGRNAPKGFIFAPAVWIRSMIEPEPGTAVVYFDYRSQEIYIAARLSNDQNMLDLLATGDPYMGFAKKRGLVEQDAVKTDHKVLRNNVLKPLLLSLRYGSEAKGVAGRLNISREFAQELVDGDRELFSTYWQWISAYLDTALSSTTIYTPLGWPLYVSPEIKLRSLQNHPIQSTGGDILRVAIIGLVANGVRVCAPVHDAVLTECPLADLAEHLELVPRIMREAAKTVLGHEIPVDHNVILPGEHYHDPRGEVMFKQVTELLEDIENGTADFCPVNVLGEAGKPLSQLPNWPKSENEIGGIPPGPWGACIPASLRVPGGSP